jgi:hypothetical protein
LPAPRSSLRQLRSNQEWKHEEENEAQAP